MSPTSTPANVEALEAQAQRLMGTFARAGYERIAPAVIQPAGLFLDVVGEALRARTYVFTDPDGAELCLRPDLTVPTCRLHLERHARGDTPARYCYSGSAFRYQPGSADQAHPREFRQAGIESFAAPDREQDDAAVCALIVAALRDAGLEPVQPAHRRPRPVQRADQCAGHAGALAPPPQAPVLAARGLPRRAQPSDLGRRRLGAEPAARADREDRPGRCGGRGSAGAGASGAGGPGADRHAHGGRDRRSPAGRGGRQARDAAAARDRRADRKLCRREIPGARGAGQNCRHHARRQRRHLRRASTPSSAGSI